LTLCANIWYNGVGVVVVRRRWLFLFGSRCRIYGKEVRALVEILMAMSFYYLAMAIFLRELNKKD